MPQNREDTKPLSSVTPLELRGRADLARADEATSAPVEQTQSSTRAEELGVDVPSV